MVDLAGRVEAEAATVGLKIIADKSKVMVTGVQGQVQEVQAGEKSVEEIIKFYYLENVIARDGS
jgi:hypothetical protein